MIVETDSRISLGLDPAQFTYMLDENNNNVVDEDNIQFVQPAIGALTDAYLTVGKLWDARAAANNNPSWTEAARIEMVGREAEKHMLRILRKIDLASQTITATLTHTRKLMSEPLTEKAGMGTLNNEIRQHVKGLGDRSAREKFMTDAETKNDEKSLAAVLGAPPYLSGFTQVDFDYFVHRYHAKRNPHLNKRVAMLEKTLERLDGITPIIHKEFRKPIGAEFKDFVAIRSASDKAMAALNIQPHE